MKKSTTKILALLLAVIMVCSLVGCGGNNNTPNTEGGNNETVGGNETTPAATEESLYYNVTGYPICDEPITIKVGGLVGNTTDWQNTYLVKYVEEKLGIKMICEPTSADIISEQYMKWLSNPDSMPDLIVNTAYDRSQVDADGADGYFVNIAEYENLIPNLLAFWEEYPSLGEIVHTADGAVYSLTRITTPGSAKINNQFYYHIPTLEAAGVDGSALKTVDDLYNALVALKAQYPDKTPLLITPDAEPAYRNDLNLRTAFGVFSNDNSYMVCTDENGEVFLGDISNEHREYLKFLNKLASEKLIDVTDFGKTKDELRAAIKDGKYCIYTDQFAPLTDADKALDAVQDYSWQQNYGIIWGFTSDANDKVTYIANNGVLNQAKIMINAESEYVEAIVRLLDFFASPEGQILAVAGEEGVTFDWKVDEVTGVKNADYSKYWDSANFEKETDWVTQKVVIQQAFAFNWAGLGAIDTLSDEELAKIPNNNASWLTAQKLLAIDDVDDFRYADVPALYTAEQKEEMATLKTDLTNYLKTAKAEFIAGIRDPYSDADWEKFVNEVNNMGWASVLKQIEQDARG